MPTVQEQVIKIVREISSVEEDEIVAPEDDLVENLGMDSLDILMVCQDLDDIYYVKLQDNTDKLKTVQDIIDFINTNYE